MKKIITTLFIVNLFASAVFCQDTLRMLNGNILEVKIERVSEDEIVFNRIHKSRRIQSILEKEEVFSFRKKDEGEVQVYQYNPEIGNIYELKEMKDYMIGERHADKDYRPLLSNILAFGAGVYSGYAISDDSHIFVAVPLVFSIMTLLPGTRVQKTEINERYLKNNAYRDGYKRVAKGRKFLSALKYSGLGMVASFFVFEATD